MKGLLIRWIVNAGALWLIAFVIKGIEVQSFLSALVAAAVLGVINAILRPIFILLTLPINLLTLGLFTFLLNGFMLYLAGTLVRGFEVHGFWAPVFGALILSIVSALTTAFLSDDGRIQRIHIRIDQE
ncbi:MAG TPA: phage holin family protein [Nitrospiria bacterium]|nr:phage holin family protein [Nitrospiria bacterium]HUJ79095.1 phage holin family protein [Nitrospiria bacterium]